MVVTTDLSSNLFRPQLSRRSAQGNTRSRQSRRRAGVVKRDGSLIFVHFSKKACYQNRFRHSAVDQSARELRLAVVYDNQPANRYHSLYHTKTILTNQIALFEGYYNESYFPPRHVPKIRTAFSMVQVSYITCWRDVRPVISLGKGLALS